MSKVGHFLCRFFAFRRSPCRTARRKRRVALRVLSSEEEEEEEEDIAMPNSRGFDAKPRAAAACSPEWRDRNFSFAPSNENGQRNGCLPYSVSHF